MSSGAEAVAGDGTGSGAGAKALKRDSGARRGEGEGSFTSGRPFSAKLAVRVSWICMEEAHETGECLGGISRDGGGRGRSRLCGLCERDTWPHSCLSGSFFFVFESLLTHGTTHGSGAVIPAAVETLLRSGRAGPEGVILVATL